MTAARIAVGPVSCLVLVWLVACASPQRQAPAPARAIAIARQAQAEKLSREQNWPAAARAWRAAADQYRLLNDLAGLAAAFRQVGLAERGRRNYPGARDVLERAAVLNEGLGRSGEWWNDQIALLQVEALGGMDDLLADRLKRLTPLATSGLDARLLGLFHTELGIYRQSRGERALALDAFNAATASFERAGDRFGVATGHANLAHLLESEGDYARALELWSGALEAFEEVAEPLAITRALAGQGRALLALGRDVERARELLGRAAENYRVLQLPDEQAAVLELLK